MAPKGKGGNFEWLVIRVETIYKVLVGIVVVLAAILGWYFTKKPASEATTAQACLEKAVATVDKVRAKISPDKIPMLASVNDQLAIARDALRRQEYAGVCPATVKAEAGALALTSGANTPQATVDDVQGTVMVKKAASPDYVPLGRNMVLEEGDILRTSSGSEALLRYPDGTRQKVGPDTIYQIRTLSRTASGNLSVNSFLEKGTFETNRPAGSPDNKITVTTPQDVTAEARPGSRIAVSQDPDTHTTAVAVMQGTGAVTHNNQTQEMSEGTQGTVKEGSAVTLTELPKLPVLMAPADLQVISTAAGESRVVKFQWTSPSGKNEFQLQIGTDPFLSKEGQLTDTPVTVSTVDIKLPPGTATYYWRVREKDAKNPAAESGIGRYIWSYTSSFKVIEQVKASSPQNIRIIELSCNLFTLSSDSVQVNCQVTPGVTVTINEQEVEVSEGRCRKTIFYSQPGLQKINVRAFDNYGNEKSQTLFFKSQTM